jgi:hypothetical protein
MGLYCFASIIICLLGIVSETLRLLIAPTTLQTFEENNKVKIKNPLYIGSLVTKCSLYTSVDKFAKSRNVYFLKCLTMKARIPGLCSV